MPAGIKYLRTNYRLTGGKVDTSNLAGSHFMQGEHTMSLTTASYYTDIATLIGFTGSILFFKAHRKWSSIGTAGVSAGQFVYGVKSTGTATCLAVFGARTFGGATSGGEVSLMTKVSVSIDGAAVHTIIATWDTLVISHY